jgi:hypothetical protein
MLYVLTVFDQVEDEIRKAARADENWRYNQERYCNMYRVRWLGRDLRDLSAALLFCIGSTSI